MKPMLFLVMAIVGCAAHVSNEDLGEKTSETSYGKQWDECGVNMQCETGLECFGFCTFECGEKYHFVDGIQVYGLDTESVDRCAAINGTCQQHAAGVDINVCKRD